MHLKGIARIGRVGSLLIAAVLFCGAGASDEMLTGPYETALVILNSSSGEVIDRDPGLSARRLSPCSTFKIYNTLIGLELGVIQDPDAPWYRWDKVTRAIEGWNRDLTLREAFRVSSVPAYQILAREIGAKRMQEFLDAISYGTRDISAGIDIFWLPRPGTVSLVISAYEQVDLLNRLLKGDLPFDPAHVAILRDIMRVRETEKGTLYGKTGSGMDPSGNGSLGWFVGFAESQGVTYPFACNITGGDNVSGKAAREIVEKALFSLGIL